jgi:hypothetical protein
VKRCPFRRCEFSPLEDLEDMKYLIMKNERNATSASEGIDSVPSSSWEGIAKSQSFKYGLQLAMCVRERERERERQ